MKKIICNICFMLGLIPKIYAQSQVYPPLPEEQRVHIKAERTTEPIKIDGIPDEAAWAKCAVASRFVTNFPKNNEKAAYETEVKILYDDRNIYICAKCDFPPGKKMMQVQNMSRDFTYSNEFFEIVMDPFKDPRQPIMSFFVTPYGTIQDGIYYPDGTFDQNWNTLWSAASTIQEHSWTTEIAIPFSSLRYPDGPTSWGINFIRNIKHLGEINSWALFPLPFVEGRTEYAGILTNLQPPPSHLNLRINPYALVNSQGSSNAKAVYKTQAGGELDYSINNSTVLEGTVNTDFSQADADVQVINLTRSSVFFPEQRQFFLENANLFSVGANGIIQPFFSRQIGLSAAGSPLPITGGLRLIHLGEKQSYGILVMKQQGDTTENGALFGVFRYKRNITNKFILGGMATLRENSSGLGTEAYLNSVGVVDAFWRVSQPLFVRGMFSVSDNSRGNQKGTAAFSELNYQNGLFALDWFETAVSKDYQAQTGFVARNDFINTQQSATLMIHRDWFPKQIDFFQPQLIANIFNQASTSNFQEASLNFIPFQLLFKDFSMVNVNVTPSWENLTTTFKPVSNINIAPGHYEFNRYEVLYFSNVAAPFYIKVRASTGGYYDGQLNSYNISLKAAPIPYISMTLSYTREDFKNTGINKKSTTTHLFAPLARLATSPKVQLSAFYQYNTNERNGSLNARFSWEYKPLSFIYLVYNNVNNFSPTPFGIPSQQQAGIFKVTYVRQL